MAPNVSSLREKRAHGTEIFPFAYYFVNPQHERYIMLPHWHKELELARILEGNLDITIDGRHYHGQRGDIFCINSGSLHSAQPHNCVYEDLVFDLQFLLRERTISNGLLYSLIYDQKHICPYLPAAHTEEQLQQSVALLMEAMQKPADPSRALLVTGYTYIFLGLIQKNTLLSDPLNAEHGSRLSKIKLALSYIHKKYKQEISLQDLADLLEVKEPSVVHIFKEMLGTTPLNYINSYRVLTAKEMLKDPHNSVTKVSIELGFSDLSYFTKVFKRYTGMTPRTYLKQQQQLPEEHRAELSVPQPPPQQQLHAEHSTELSPPLAPPQSPPQALAPPLAPPLALPQTLDAAPRATHSPKNKAASPPQKRHGQSKRLVS